MVNKEFINRLKAAVETFADDGAQLEFQDILTLVFEGLRKNYSVTAAYLVDVENQEGHLFAQKFEDGSESALIFTEEADPRNKSTIELTLRAILDDMNRNEVCDGFIINPGEDDVFISKILLQTALDAGYAYAQEEIEKEAELLARQDREHELICERPISEQLFAEIAQRIRGFEEKQDDFLKISFLHEKDTLFAQVLRSDEGRHLSFGIDMSAWSWDEPLVLGSSMPTEAAIEMLRKVCVEGKEPDDLTEIEEFRKM